MTEQRTRPRPKDKSRPNLDFVQDFIQTLSKNLERTDTPSGLPWMHHSDEGALFLTDSEQRQFRTTLRKLVTKLASDGRLSAATTSNVFQNAIFESLDIQGRRSSDFSTRLNHAIQRLEELAFLPIEAHECFVEVCGLDPKSLPAQFGSVKFIVFNRYQLSRLRHKGGTLGESVRESATDMLGRYFGRIAVDARDDRAAIAIAERQTRSTVDSLNFFVDMMPYNHGWVFLPGDREQREVASATLKPDGSCYFAMSRTKPLAYFSMRMLRSTESIGDLVRSVPRLLGKRRRTKVEDLLLTAVQTAGRATVAARPEESFLLFAIALESLVLPQQGQELTYRLAQRVARVLGKDAKSRIKYSKEVRRLYGIRSKIVHSGSYEISAIDRDSMRIYTKMVIKKMLSSASVRRCKTTRELDQWLEELALK
ncbi:MAG: HEPN domain-containing protein [Gammaproteobacteria bacterium]|nr:HEPN domain-containing protein [Gammaproteobacteria bacterium]